MELADEWGHSCFRSLRHGGGHVVEPFLGLGGRAAAAHRPDQQVGLVRVPVEERLKERRHRKKRPSGNIGLEAYILEGIMKGSLFSTFRSQRLMVKKRGLLFSMRVLGFHSGWIAFLGGDAHHGAKEL